MKPKKILISVGLISTLPLICFAQGSFTGIVLPSRLGDALNNLFNFVFGFLLALAVIFIMLAAYNFVTGGGDPQKVEMARNQILWAVIGLLLAGLAKALALAVAGILSRG